MINFKNRVLLVAALAVCTALVSAQGQGQGQGQGGGRQRGQGGQGQRGFGQMNRGGGNELTLVMRKDVQADLVITEDQKTKLTELQTKLRPARGQGGQGGGQRGQGGGGQGQGGNGGNGGQGGTVDREAMQKRQAEQREATHKALAEVLSADQLKRLGEISVQLQGNRAVLSPEVQKTLAITAEQKTKIDDLQTKMREANTALFEKVRNNELSQEDAMKSAQNNNTVMDGELAKVLTAAQNAKLKEMQGKPFKADPAEAQGQRRGGGGGN